MMNLKSLCHIGQLVVSSIVSSNFVLKYLERRIYEQLIQEGILLLPNKKITLPKSQLLPDKIYKSNSSMEINVDQNDYSINIVAPDDFNKT